jgi:hypothetical protein
VKRVRSFFSKLRQLEETHARAIAKLVKQEQDKIKSKLKHMTSSDYIGASWNSALEVLTCFDQVSEIQNTYSSEF